MKKELPHAVIRNENIGESIVIVIRERHAERPALARSNVGMFADVLESAIAAIAVQNASGGRKCSRRAVSLPLVPADFAVLRVPEHITRHEQVEVPVVVVIKESSRTAP